MKRFRRDSEISMREQQRDRKRAFVKREGNQLNFKGISFFLCHEKNEKIQKLFFSVVKNEKNFNFPCF